MHPLSRDPLPPKSAADTPFRAFAVRSPSSNIHSTYIDSGVHIAASSDSDAVPHRSSRRSSVSRLTSRRHVFAHGNAMAGNGFDNANSGRSKATKDPLISADDYKLSSSKGKGCRYIFGGQASPRAWPIEDKGQSF